MRVIVSSFLMLCLSATSVAFAETKLDASTKQNLVKLERKYFGHSFDTDEPEIRTSRLEKLMFGDENSGEVKERVEKMLALSPVEDAPIADAAAAGTKPKKLAAQPKQTASGDPAEPPAAPSFLKKKTNQHFLAGEDEVELRDYPHITVLEKSILGRSFVGQPLSARLARLETKAFGTPSMLPDFSQRTDALEDFAEKSLKQKPFGVEEVQKTAELPSGGGSDSSVGKATNGVAATTGASSQPDYPHITSLEKNILGQTFVGQDLPARLGRLETTAFGKPTASNDLSQRTDALDQYATKKLHKKPFAEQQAKDAEIADGKSSDGQQKSSPGSGRALAMVANTLLGAAGMGLGPMGMMGAGMGRAGFGGARIGQQKQAQQAAVVEKEDDPAVFTALPPTADAKLQVKVGWCEVKTFGHTFQSLHLTDRLRQLSRQLDFETKKSDLELMDDIGGLLKVVQLRQGNNPRPIGSAAQPAVQ